MLMFRTTKYKIAKWQSFDDDEQNKSFVLK